MITEGVQQVLTVLYPLYKEEVYRRREQMMLLTAYGSLGLLAMLFALLLSPQRDRLTSFDTLFIGLASLIWCGLFCALILQQQYRHRLAKQVLVQLEQALGFYEEGLVTENLRSWFSSSKRWDFMKKVWLRKIRRSIPRGGK